MICTRDLALLAGLVLAAPGLAACDGSVEDPSGTGAAAPTQPAQQRADIAAMHGERALLAGRACRKCARFPVSELYSCEQHQHDIRIV